MSGWKGFTDADLKRISGTHSVDEGGDNSPLGNGTRQAGAPRQSPSAAGASKPAKLGPRARQGPARRPLVGMGSSKAAAAAQLSPGERLSQQVSPRARPSVQPPPPDGTLAAHASKQEHAPAVNASNEQRTGNGPVLEDSRCAEVDEIDEQEAVSRNLTNLDAARQRQRLMEEENKRRRKLLVEAIANKKKQTQAEHARLMKIQKELEKLDEMIFNDVNILRDRIEESSRTYLEAKRRYDRAEKEFIEAKIDLFEKTRSKEELTEHLYTIIQENEIRKSKKLSELSGLLEMPAASGDAPEGVNVDDIASQLSLLNAMAPQAIRTPHVDPSAPRKSPRSSSSDKTEKQQLPDPTDGQNPKPASDANTDQENRPKQETAKPSGGQAGSEATINKAALQPEQDAVSKSENEAIAPAKPSSEDVTQAGKAADSHVDQEQPSEQPTKPPDQS